MKKIAQIPMRIRTAVEAVEKALNRGQKGTFINTEFGTLGIEFHKPRVLIDPLNPVDIVPWKEAPGTFWVRSNRDEVADYYIRVEIFQSQLIDHVAIIEALSRAMMMRLGFDDPSEKIINSLIVCFTTNYDPVDETIDAIMSEYMFNYMGMTVRRRSDVQLVVREMISSKIDLAKEVLRSSELLVRSLEQNGADEVFYDLYSKQVWGIYLYALQEDQRSMTDKVKNLADVSKNEIQDYAIKASLIAAND